MLQGVVVDELAPSAVGADFRWVWCSLLRSVAECCRLL